MKTELRKHSAKWQITQYKVDQEIFNSATFWKRNQGDPMIS